MIPLGLLGLAGTATAANYNFAGQVVTAESTSGGYAADNWTGVLNSNAGYAFSKPVNGQSGSGHYYLTPFEPAWTTSTSAAAYGGPVGLAEVKAGSTLVLQFASSSGFAASTSDSVNNGFNLGVHAGVGIVDTSADSSNSYSGSGVAGSPAITFNSRVSYLAVGDGSRWVWYAGQTLNAAGTQVLSTQWTSPVISVPTASAIPGGAAEMTFNNPSAFYAGTGVFPDGGNNTIAPANGTPTADASRDFSGTLSAFNGENYSQVMATLGGSAGGDWFNLSGTGLAEVTQIAFVVPAGGNPMYVQAVVGVTTPEPAELGLLAAGAAGMFLLRRRGVARSGEK